MSVERLNSELAQSNDKVQEGVNSVGQADNEVREALGLMNAISRGTNDPDSAGRVSSR